MRVLSQSAVIASDFTPPSMNAATFCATASASAATIRKPSSPWFLSRKPRTSRRAAARRFSLFRCCDTMPIVTATPAAAAAVSTARLMYMYLGLIFHRAWQVVDGL